VATPAIPTGPHLHFGAFASDGVQITTSQKQGLQRFLHHAGGPASAAYLNPLLIFTKFIIIKYEK